MKNYILLSRNDFKKRLKDDLKSYKSSNNKWLQDNEQTIRWIKFPEDNKEYCILSYSSLPNSLDKKVYKKEKLLKETKIMTKEELKVFLRLIPKDKI